MKAERLAAGFAGAAIFTSALWCGTLADRSQVSPGAGNIMQLYGLPTTAALAACGLIVAWWSNEKKANLSLPGILGPLLILFSLLSFFRTRDISSSLVVLLIPASALAAGAASIRAGKDDFGRWGLFIGLAACGAVVAGTGLSEYALHAREGDTSWRVFSTFAMPNFLAGFLVMHVPLAAALFLASKDRLASLFGGFALMLEAACLLLTGSRFGLLGATVAFCSFLGLAVWSGALAGSVRKRTLGLLGICAVAGIIGAKPILTRIAGAGGESYSGKFRTMTWRGTLDMAAHNPILGTGIGTYPTAYARYARVGYTEHAHNSYLQLAAEAGFLTAIILIVALALPVWLGVRRLRHLDGRKEPAADEPFQNSILVAGLVAAIIGAMVRNLFDSDLYVAANSVTVAVICGLASSFAGGIKIKRFELPTATLKSAAAVFAIITVFLGGRTAIGRSHAYTAQEALIAGNATAALDEFRAAAAADGSNPEYHLNSADVLSRTGDKPSAETEFRSAITAADIGKTHYRYGKFLMESGRFKDAVGQFRAAEQRDPHYLQNLLLMADALKADQQPEEAIHVYQKIVTLYHSPVGELRALPEQIPWEFGIAYLGLAEDALAKGESARAEVNLRDGGRILDDFWRLRNDARNHVRPEVWEKVTSRFGWALEQLEKLDRQRGDAAGAAEWSAKRATYLAELDEENKKRQAGGGK